VLGATAVIHEASHKVVCKNGLEQRSKDWLHWSWRSRWSLLCSANRTGDHLEVAAWRTRQIKRWRAPLSTSAGNSDEFRKWMEEFLLAGSCANMPVKLRPTRFEKELADRQAQRTSGHKSNKRKVLIGCIARAHTHRPGDLHRSKNRLGKSLHMPSARQAAWCRWVCSRAASVYWETWQRPTKPRA